MVAKKRAGEARGKGVRGIFVLAADERNSAFWGPGNRFDCFREYLREIRGEMIPDVFRVSVQDIVARFSNSLADYKEFFTVKYDFPPGDKLSRAGPATGGPRSVCSCHEQ